MLNDGKLLAECYDLAVKLTIRLLREADGRWIGEVPELPGVLLYGATPEEPRSRRKLWRSGSSLRESNTAK